MTWEGLTPPYRTIVADPPWPYASTGGLPRTTRLDGVRHRGVHERGYDSMSMEELASLPVQELLADACHLYLWATNRFIVEAHSLAVSWGFRPITILTWVKTQHADPEKVSYRSGFYFRGATEHIVFAVRGSQPLLTKEPFPTAFLWPRIGTHSVKPAAFFDLVQQCSPGPYLELFSRTPLLGWDSWGKGWEAAS